jgi:hypothetical protein
MDFAAQGAALATRYNATNCPAPAGGYQAIRYATNFPAAAVGPLPCVLVLPDEGEFATGNGKRESHETWKVRFYFAETNTPEKDYKALQLWLSVLVDATKGAVQFAGSPQVEYALVEGWRVGALSYGGKQYSGIELTVHIEAHESWLPTA